MAEVVAAPEKGRDKETDVWLAGRKILAWELMAVVAVAVAVGGWRLMP
jgi:hypothetical protein